MSNVSQVSVERRGSIAVVSFANPPQGTIAVRGASQLAAAIEAELADDAVRAIVLTGGQDGIFIRHADVGQIARAAEALQANQTSPEAWVGAAFPKLMRLIEQADKPIIAAIDGLCMGGGFEIALSCMMRIASPRATSIGLPEIRIAVIPANGTKRLARLIGPHRARLFMLEGRVLNAHAAQALGLVDEVAEEPVARAIEWAEGIARRNQSAVTAILRLTRDDGLAAGLDEEQIAMAELLRDDPRVLERVRQFCELGELLNEID